MKYDIEYEENVRRTNTITIEVEDEDEGEQIADELSIIENRWVHPDDIVGAISEMGVKIISRCEGAESAEYTIE